MWANQPILAALLLCACIAPILGQDAALCAYFTAIPKEQKPDYVEQDFTGVPWSQRPLLPPPDRDDICTGEYVPAGNTFGTQMIYIDEEIEGDVIVAKLNYDGNEVPYLGAFLMGTRNLLNAVIRQIPELDNAWYLVITSRQDYETPDMRHYMFEVRVDSETLVARVNLEVVNIDDNAPVIQYFEPCTVPELGNPGPTECVYEVTDADGYISTSVMSFHLDSDRGDEDVFGIDAVNVPNDWYTMIMTLTLIEPLDFEMNALHIFSITASDSLPNNHTISMMVQVENVEHRPPRWVEIWAVQQFDEKTSQNFTVRAIDGDTGINKPILYRLANNESYPFFSIVNVDEGRGGGIFYVEPIDRDTLEQEVFQLSIIAYKFDNDSFATEAPIVIIINDVNDQIPEPLHEEYWISFAEETPLTLDLGDEFGFHDRDLGEHAQYSVFLEDIYPPGAASAFYIAPEVGYQRQLFTMGTRNHSLLDYEVPEFQHITLRVVAQDRHNLEFIGNATVYIDLINWNDELPIFNETIQYVAFNETEGAGFFVGTVRADDRDIDDRVVHTLMGNAVDYLSIDEDTGDIYVTVNNSFDYHRQNELFVQIRADDTLGEPYNIATTQLVIQLYDINNTPPTLRLPRGNPSVEENVPEGFEITDQIEATDPDTTAELIFEIDWETSYASKLGPTDPAEYHGCVEIETVYPDVNNTGYAIGRVVVKEIRNNVTIDYEMFEMLYLTVRVVDVNTVEGDDFDELTFTIIIIDMNDNPPIWAAGTLETAFRVRELSASEVVIGSVLATDIDGPLYNQVRYTIFPREDTPEDLVKIDFYTGQIDVDTDRAIDADDPPREYLYYTVIASDRCYADDPADCPPDPTYWETPGNITIQILDTNNRWPEALTDLFNTTVYIYENATTGDEVLQLITNDIDRDEMYHTVRYQINYHIEPRLMLFFSVDVDTGMISVDYTTNDVLDRDGDEPEHRIFLTYSDNFYFEGDGNRNQQDIEILVVLLDVNDNAPELPPPEDLSWSISEDLGEGIRVLPEIYAPDRDEPDTDNSRVGYAILSLTDVDKEVDLPELFTMVNIDNVTGELETAMPLRGYWGTYDIHILAYDHGIPQQSSNETYTLEIRPFNYHAPEFVYPPPSTTLRLSRESAQMNNFITLVNGEFMERIVATDEDGLHAGEVTLTVTGDEDAQQFFMVSNSGDNTGDLILTQLFPETTREFQVTITATDGGTEPQSLSTQTTLTLAYVPTTGDPVFTITTADVAFVELDAGLDESHTLPTAEDPKNHLCSDDCHDIYYMIIGGNDDGHFALVDGTNVLRVVIPLVREDAETHTLLIAASNSLTATAVPTSVLTVTVTVREADPRPIFARDLYTAGISTLDTINRELLTVQATHSEGSAIIYSIDLTTMIVDSTLEAVKDSAFSMHPQTGVLTLSIQPTASMHGMFEFDVVATDPANATGRTEVKVYLISTENRVIFLFYNTLEQIEQNVDFIASTFSTVFNLTCNIDQVVPASDSNGLALDDLTEARAHFIQDDIPVPADVIEVLRSDTPLLRSIQLMLNQEQLFLSDFVTDLSPDVTSDNTQMQVYVLIGLTVILALMCLLLLCTYIIKTKALNRRLQALSTTKFGSIDSGMNRAGIVVPGTNKHAVEGSNPIWNEQIRAPDFDAISDTSSDSDLIGIENLPQFQFDYFPPGDDTSLTGLDNNVNNVSASGLPNHSNNFGFNNSPFSPEFANRPFYKR